MIMWVKEPHRVENSPLLLQEKGPNHNPGMTCCARRLFSYSHGSLQPDDNGLMGEQQSSDCGERGGECSEAEGAKKWEASGWPNGGDDSMYESREKIPMKTPRCVKSTEVCKINRGV
jgi:hypothetical protein